MILEKIFVEDLEFEKLSFMLFQEEIMAFQRENSNAYLVFE